MMKKVLSILTILALLPLASACGNGSSGETQRYQAEFLDLFDTMTQIVAYTDDEDLFSRQAKFVYDNMEVYHQLFDIYNDYEGINNLKTVNDHAGKEPVAVDPKIIEMLEFSKEIYRITDGKVNVAFGSVLYIWHEYRDAGAANPERAKLPPMEELEAARLHTNIDKVLIDKEAGTVYLSDPEMRLDVGAIAKGFATEEVADLLEEKWPGISILLSVGGNVKAIGMKDAGEGPVPWGVGVTDPNNETQSLMTLRISGQSMVTSGDYQRYYEVDGVRYHHIIDPATMFPAMHCRSVTILAEDSGFADGLSTAAFILPVPEAMALIESKGAEAVFVMEDGSLVYTDGFRNYLKD